jgi:hypothetical protein
MFVKLCAVREEQVTWGAVLFTVVEHVMGLRIEIIEFENSFSK